jgi:hypothetical protein
MVTVTSRGMKQTSRRLTCTLEDIKEYLASQYGGTWATLDYIIQAETTVKPEADDPVEECETMVQETTVHAPHSGRDFVNDMQKVWDIMSNIFGKHFCLVYIKRTTRTNNGREAYILMLDHFLGPIKSGQHG